MIRSGRVVLICANGDTCTEYYNLLGVPAAPVALPQSGLYSGLNQHAAILGGVQKQTFHSPASSIFECKDRYGVCVSHDHLTH
jgi:hypothetical protein